MRTEDRVDMDRSIGELIHGLMWRRRVTQLSLAPAIGIDNSALARKLRGERAWTSSDLVNVARVLGVSFELTESGCAIRDEQLPRLDSNQQPSGYQHLQVVRSPKSADLENVTPITFVSNLGGRRTYEHLEDRYNRTFRHLRRVV